MSSIESKSLTVSLAMLSTAAVAARKRPVEYSYWSMMNGEAAIRQATTTAERVGTSSWLRSACCQIAFEK